jgi:glycosyltransferase involved in cell wall biosynthesis
MNKPTVSIGLPVYNGEKYLATALHSIVSQDFEDFELIISDNASQDNTAAICREFSESDRRVKYSRVEVNRGAAPNYRRVFQLAEGAYFKWAAHDDACLPGFLKHCVDAIERAPASVVLVYPRAQIIDAEGKVTRVDHESLQSRDSKPYRRAAHVVRNVSLAWPLFGVIRADALRKTRLIDSFIGSDYVLLAELAMIGQLWEIPEVLFQRRVYPGMSNVVHQTRAQWAAWMDSSQSANSSPLPDFVQIGWQCAKSACRLPLTITEKALCCLIVPTAWYLRNLRDLGGRYKSKLLRATGVRAVSSGS